MVSESGAFSLLHNDQKSIHQMFYPLIHTDEDALNRKDHVGPVELFIEIFVRDHSHW